MLSERRVRQLIQEDFNSRSTKGLSAAISRRDLNSITEALDDSIKAELPKIVSNELKNLPLSHLVEHEFLNQMEKLVDSTLKLQATFGTNSSDVKQDTPTTPQSTPETATTEPSNSPLTPGEVSEELDILISRLTTLKKHLPLSSSNVQAGDSGPVAADNLDSDKNPGKSERALNDEWFVCNKRDLSIWLAGQPNPQTIYWLEWAGDPV